MAGQQNGKTTQALWIVVWITLLSFKWIRAETGKKQGDHAGR